MRLYSALVKKCCRYSPLSEYQKFRRSTLMPFAFFALLHNYGVTHRWNGRSCGNRETVIRCPRSWRLVFADWDVAPKQRIPYVRIPCPASSLLFSATKYANVHVPKNAIHRCVGPTADARKPQRCAKAAHLPANNSSCVQIASDVQK
jgi:hypothetical protein